MRRERPAFQPNLGELALETLQCRREHPRMRVNHASKDDLADLVHNPHRRPLAARVQSCIHAHCRSPFVVRESPAKASHLPPESSNLMSGMYLRLGISLETGALFVTLFALGNILFQLPIGFASDQMDRGKLLLSLGRLRPLWGNRAGCCRTRAPRSLLLSAGHMGRRRRQPLCRRTSTPWLALRRAGLS